MLFFRTSNSEEEKLARSKKKKNYAKCQFFIESIDPLGQGVSKTDEKTTFVSKVLPDESGTAKIYRKAKGVQFAKLHDQTDLSKASNFRITPECEHFASCQGCHFLHTSYHYEQVLKVQMANQYFRNMPISPTFELIPNSERFGYRNRIQLHYDYPSSRLGLIDKVSGKIVEVSQCKLPTTKLRQKLNSLYKDNIWKELVQTENARDKGHIELLETSDGVVSVVLNSAYSHGGFTQVNPEMNDKMLNRLHEEFFNSDSTLMELFSGSGNLTKALNPAKAWLFDYGELKVELPKKFSFTQIDLFQENIVDLLVKEVDQEIEVLLLDPPRKGFAELAELVKRKNPKKVIYISCNLNTMVRDISPILEDYQITHSLLFDMFPGTRHFETLCAMQRVNQRP
jgi:23S rRNA (uracil1939-C5)-methyltransferase